MEITCTFTTQRRLQTLCVRVSAGVRRPEEETQVAMETQGRAAPLLAENARHAFCTAQMGGGGEVGGLSEPSRGLRSCRRGFFFFRLVCSQPVVRRRERLKCGSAAAGVELAVAVCASARAAEWLAGVRAELQDGSTSSKLLRPSEQRHSISSTSS